MKAQLFEPIISGITTVRTTSSGSRMMKRCTSESNHATKRSRESPAARREKRQP